MNHHSLTGSGKEGESLDVAAVVVNAYKPSTWEAKAARWQVQV